MIGSILPHQCGRQEGAAPPCWQESPEGAVLCRYSLEWLVDSDNCFDIDTVEGTISTNDYVDREAALQHNITVLATKVSKCFCRKERNISGGFIQV